MLIFLLKEKFLVEVGCEFLEDTSGPEKFKAGISLQVLDNINRDIEEEKQRKIDDKRMKDLKN